MSLQLRKHYEGLHDGDLSQIGLQPKMCPAGVWTEGYGKAMMYHGKFLKGIANKKMAYALATIKTEAEAEADLLARTQPILLTIQRKITVPLNENQIDALVSFIDNTGGSGALFKLINTKSPKLYEWWTSHYITGQGNPTPLKGLVARRKTEALLFTEGKLQFFN